MRKQFYNEPEDIAWLFETHLKHFPLCEKQTKSFILRGNEDCPQGVELYDTKMPLIDDKPLIKFFNKRGVWRATWLRPRLDLSRLQV
jgi:hypothetical protein